MCGVVLLWWQGGVFWFNFWFNLTDEIYANFKKIYDGGLKDEFVNDIYKSDFSKNPFWDAISNVDSMSDQIKVAWTKYVQELLAQDWCNMSEKAVWTILYYFIPEFRSDISRSLKMNIWYSNDQYIIDEEELMKYCKEYYNSCGNSGWEWEVGEDEKMTSSTPADIKTNCKEFFEESYREWKKGEELLQKIYVAQLGADMYWNNSMDDSPYDIMTDMWTLSKLMYQDVKDPITPVFFDIPLASNSKETIKKDGGWTTSPGKSKSKTKKAGLTTSIENDKLYNEVKDGASLWWKWGLTRAALAALDLWGSVSLKDLDLQWEARDEWKSVSIWDENLPKGEVNLWDKPLRDVKTVEDEDLVIPLNDKVPSKSPQIIRDTRPVEPQNDTQPDEPQDDTQSNEEQDYDEDGDQDIDEDEPVAGGGIEALPFDDNSFYEEEYDSLVEWLDAFALTDNSFRNNVCVDEEEIDEPEPEEWYNDVNTVLSTIEIDNRSFAEMDKEEYAALVEQMLAAVDSYASLSEDKAEDIDKAASSRTEDFSTTDDPAEQDETSLKEIESCMELCKDDELSLDEKATCILKCACWKKTSPVFDPEKNPWLWPIYYIRLCSVPTKESTFSIRWKKILSLEEWMNEVYGVVNKLSSEWRLWKWTQQKWFLSASTNQMKMGDSLSFTIDVEFVDISTNEKKSSDQYTERKMESDNEVMQTTYNISNPLDNPATKNTYRMMWTQWEAVKDVITSANPDQNRDIQNELNQRPEPLIDMNETTNAGRYASLSEALGARLDWQWAFWTEIYNYTSDVDSYAQMLYNKKCD